MPRLFVIIGAGDGSRTHDLMITNHLLWPLSYPGTVEAR